jgi:hypothetical protein
MTHPEPDPLADIFPDTLDAPLPRWSFPPANTARSWLLPARTDQRWAPRPPVPAELKDGTGA